MLDDNADFKTINHAHPHIGKQLLALWGQPGFLPYMQSLTRDDRPTVRQGFADNVFLALLRLSEQHLRAYPDYMTDIPARYARAYAFHKEAYVDKALAETRALIASDPDTPRERNTAERTPPSAPFRQVPCPAATVPSA